MKLWKASAGWTRPFRGDGPTYIILNKYVTITTIKKVICKDSVLWKILTGAIEMVHDGVQKGVLWREEALHHRHLGLYGWNAYYWISILSTEKLEERVSFTVRLTVPQCSDAGSYSFCQSPPPPSPQKTISCSFPRSTNLQCQWGRSRSQRSVPQPQLHVFAATSHSPASLPPLPPFKCVHHPSFFVHLSAMSPSLSPPFSLYLSLPYIVSTF